MSLELPADALIGLSNSIMDALDERTTRPGRFTGVRQHERGKRDDRQGTNVLERAVPERDDDGTREGRHGGDREPESLTEAAVTEFTACLFDVRIERAGLHVASVLPLSLCHRDGTLDRIGTDPGVAREHLGRGQGADRLGIGAAHEAAGVDPATWLGRCDTEDRRGTADDP